MENMFCHTAPLLRSETFHESLKKAHGQLLVKLLHYYGEREAAAHTAVTMSTAATHASSEPVDASASDIKLLKDQSIECETEGSVHAGPC